MSKLTLSFKGKVLKVFPVVQGDMFIGSDPSCTLRIDSLAVQPKHARLHTVAAQSVLYDLDSPDGTFVNQVRITEHTLKDGEVIRVGKHTLTYTFEEIVATEPEAATEPPPAPAETAPSSSHEPRPAWLQILSGQNLGKTLSLHRALTNLGKPGVVTAVIARRTDGYFLSHLEGAHPPQVGDEPIGERAYKLRDGDIIQIGNVKMQFYYD